jgi:hypothetical protein
MVDIWWGRVEDRIVVVVTIFERTTTAPADRRDLQVKSLGKCRKFCEAPLWSYFSFSNS